MFTVIVFNNGTCVISAEPPSAAMHAYVNNNCKQLLIGEIKSTIYNFAGDKSNGFEKKIHPYGAIL